MFWYSSNVTLESKVFFLEILIREFGVRACVVAVISARAVKRMVTVVVTVVRCEFYQLSVSLLRSLLLLR